MLSCVDAQILDMLITAPNYEENFRNRNALEIYHSLVQVCVGRGAVSVYAIILQLLNLKQDGAYTKFEKRFKELVREINAQGNEAELLQMIYIALFITSLDQQKFKDKLRDVYGQQVWPDFEVFSLELHNYDESVDRVNSFIKDNNDGRIQANVVKDGGATPPNICWNCAKAGHRRFDCPNEPHVCSLCIRKGHLEKYCLGGDPSRVSTGKGPVRPLQGKGGKGGKPRVGKDGKPVPKTNKSAARKRIIDKVKGLQVEVQGLVSQLDEIGSNVDDYESNEYNEEVDDDDHYYDDGYDDVNGNVTQCDVVESEDDFEHDKNQ
jgi:hypothetical protein